MGRRDDKGDGLKGMSVAASGSGSHLTDIYKIILTIQTDETFTGKMTRSQPELVNGFLPLATETGEWRYFRPDSVE